MIMPPKFSLVVPTYNERSNIAELYRRIAETLDSLPFDSEIIFVDDNSPDLTWQAAGDLAKQDKRVKVIHRTNQRGLASAVVDGWAAAAGQMLGVIDADLQHPPEILARMLKLMFNDEDIDLVVASRYAKGGEVVDRRLWQVFRSKLALFLSRVFLPKMLELVKDLSGYFILRRRVIEGISLSPVGHKILPEVLVRGRCRKVFEVPYTFQRRKSGRSKAGWKQYLVSLAHLIKLSAKK